jgi:hypothetical protein
LIHLERSIDRGRQSAVFEPNGSAFGRPGAAAGFLLAEFMMGPVLASKPDDASSSSATARR